MISLNKIITRTFLVGVILALPIILTTVFSNQICDSYSLFSPCAWIASALLMWGLLLLWIGSEIYLILFYRKPKFYRSLIIVGLSTFTLLSLLLFFETFGPDIEDITIPAIIFFSVIYPLVNIFYYWLFNSFLPRFTK